MADSEAVLVIDEAGFLKQSKVSCGVHRQHASSAGKITNCQIDVFAVHVPDKGYSFIDRALRLPQVWTRDSDRLAGAHVPDGNGFATKPSLAITMIERALAAAVPFA